MRVASRSVPLSLLFVVLRASPSTPGVSAHLRPRIVALREELDHSQAGERGGKEQCVCVSVCVCLWGKFHLKHNLKNACVSAFIHFFICPPLCGVSTHFYSVVYCLSSSVLRLPQYLIYSSINRY